MATLAAVQRAPFRGWPTLPFDSSGPLSRGVHIYAANQRNSSVKMFLDILKAELQQALNDPTRMQQVASLRDLFGACVKRLVDGRCVSY